MCLLSLLLLQTAQAPAGGPDPWKQYLISLAAGPVAALVVVIVGWVVNNTNLNTRMNDFRSDLNQRASDSQSVVNKRLDDFRGDVNKRMDEFRSDIGGRIGELRSDLTGRMTTLQENFHMEMKVVRLEGQTAMAKVLSEIAALRTELSSQGRELVSRVGSLESRLDALEEEIDTGSSPGRSYVRGGRARNTGKAIYPEPAESAAYPAEPVQGTEAG